MLEVCVFLGRAAQRLRRCRRSDRSSKVKFANLVHLTHRDEVEPPFTDWLREAYELQDPSGLAKPPGEAKTARVGTAQGREARQGAGDPRKRPRGLRQRRLQNGLPPVVGGDRVRRGAAVQSVATLGRP